MRELRNGPIAVKRGRTRACKREEKADLQRPNNVSRIDDRGPASSRATRIRPSSAREHKHHLGHRPWRTCSAYKQPRVIHTRHLWRGALLGICNGNQAIDLVTMQRYVRLHATARVHGRIRHKDLTGTRLPRQPQRMRQPSEPSCDRGRTFWREFFLSYVMFTRGEVWVR